MQVSIFNMILFKFNEIMKKKNRRIILLIDNAPVHFILNKTREKLNSVEVKFLLLLNFNHVMQI